LELNGQLILDILFCLFSARFLQAVAELAVVPYNEVISRLDTVTHCAPEIEKVTWHSFYMHWIFLGIMLFCFIIH
jgi:hypothetical protein